MSGEVLIKGFIMAILSGGIVWIVYSRENDELGYTDRQRYLPYINGLLLPVYLLCLFLLEIVLFGIRHAAQTILSVCFSIFPHIGIYYAILLPLLPLLRRYFNGRTCAIFWMIPNFLYITLQNAMRLPMPLFVIKASGNLVWILFGIWFMGALFILGRRIASHLIFRHRILKDARPVNDPEILAVWNRELERAQFRKPGFQLVFSPVIAVPLTIGLMKRKVRVVLPTRQFSSEELSLIFRHEMIHIGREDSWSKFFMVFCTAMCWFNPLMWIAMRKSAEDLELSCDETVLVSSDEDTRRRYAELLLQTAGDERGFSTCLSASASALRYRLKNVVNPPQKRSGALFLGIIFFVLCMSCGYVALSYGGSTGAQLIFQSRDPSRYILKSVYARENTGPDGDFHMGNESFREVSNVDREALYSYLSSLRMTDLTGNYSFSGSKRECVLVFGTPDGTFGVCLYDHAVKLVPLYGKKNRSVFYYLPDGMDWEYLDSLMPEAS